MRDVAPYTSSMAHAYTYIEGIGSLLGPIYPIGPLCFGEFSFAMCCFEHNDSFPEVYLEYQNCYYNWVFDNHNCNCINPPYADIPTISREDDKPKITPHPLQASSLIKWEQPIDQGRLKISDATGRIVHSEEIRNTNNVPIGQLLKKAGIYFYEITDIKNKRTARGKIAVP